MEQTSETQPRSTLPPLEEDGFILLTDLYEIVPLHPQHIRKLSRRGDFPAIVKVGGRAAFRRSEIKEWCRSQC